MLHSPVLPKFSTALALALWFAAPAAATTSDSLSTRLDRLDKDVAQAHPEMQVAQLYNRPPDSVPGGDGGGYGNGGGSDAANLDVRVDRLENQIRTLNGQIEQMQFDIHRLDDELQKFQQDVDFRLQDNGHAGGVPATNPARTGQQHHSENDEQSLPTDAAPAEQAASNYGAPGPGTRGSDAFNPASDPNAPGAPHALGAMRDGGGTPDDSVEPPVIDAPAAAESRPLPQGPIGVSRRDPNAPLELSSAAPTDSGEALPTNPAYAAPPSSPAAEAPTSGAPAMPATGAQRMTPNGTQLASLTPSTPRDDFDAATAALRGEQFDTAEAAFKSFIDKYPKDKLVPDAVFYLGETYFQRNRYREAAEQYLKISSDYSKTTKAPDSLLRLGEALDKLGAKEQACAAFAEVGRKYPSASASLRAAADREAKRVQC